MLTMAAARIDLEAMLPVAQIRTHCKIDDVPSVTDAQIVLYREAAIEACESYTGQYWRGSKHVDQDIAIRSDGKSGGVAAYLMGGPRGRLDTRVRLDHPTLDGVVTIMGSNVNRIVRAKPGAREIRVPIDNIALEGNCCHPCAVDANFGMRALYTTGVSCLHDVPAGIKLGCLKYIAWLIENPGDELNTVGTAQTLRVRLNEGTNNGIWGSGALEVWRQYRNDVFR